MLKRTFITLSLLAPLAASAGIAEDLARIRPLLPSGSDVAQIQVGILQGSSPEEAIELGKSNYLLRDINQDGREDVLVISEENPRLENNDTNQPCGSTSEENCYVVYGKRALHLFLGQADGSQKLAFTNDKMILNGDEGGVFGDPLNGFSVRPNGTIVYSVYGGSAWRWSSSATMQWRRNDLFVIGEDSYYGWTGDLRADTKSVNLLTGQVVETHQKDGDSPVRTKKYRIAVKPLPRVATYTGASPN